MTSTSLALYRQRRQFLWGIPSMAALALLPGCGGSSGSNGGVADGISDSELDARLRAMQADYQAAWKTAFDAYKVDRAQDIAALSRQLTQYQTQVDAQTQAIKVDIASLQSLSSRPDSMLVTLTSSLSSVSSTVSSMSTTLKNLSDSVTSLSDTVSPLSAQAPQVSSRLSTLETDLAALQTRVNAAQTSITQLQASVAASASASDLVALSSTVSGLSTQLSSLTTTVSSLSSTVTGLSSTVSTQITSLQQQITTNANAVQTAITSLRRYLNVTDFGAVGDGTTDDTQAFIRCITAALALNTGSYTIYVPKGVFRITAKLTCWKYDVSVGRRSARFIGEAKGVTNISFEPATENSVLFEHAEGFGCRDMSVAVVQAAGTSNQWGIAFSTPLNAQSVFSRIENISVRGSWKYAFFRRFSIWDTYSSVDSRGARCHFMFAISASHDTPLADAGVGWNGGSLGWFHNQATFASVLCEGGEVGIMGGVMGFNFVELTCQGHAGNGANNTILPANQPGTGLWIQGRNASDPARGNVIGSYYTEVTERPIYLENCTPITLTHAFVQGVFAPTTPAAAAIELKAASLNIMALTIRGRFTEWVKATNNATALVFLTNGGGWTNVQYSADNSSSITDMAALRPDRLFRLTRANGAATEDIDLFDASQYTYKVRISGATNGQNTDAAYLLNNGALSRITAEDHSTTPADFTAAGGARGLRLSVVNNRFRVSRLQNFPCDVYIQVEKFNYSAV